MSDLQDRIVELEAENDALRKSLALVKEALASANGEIAELKKTVADAVADHEQTISAYWGGG